MEMVRVADWQWLRQLPFLGEKTLEEKRYRIYIWQFISTYVLCTYIRISIYHNKLDLTNLMP